MSDHLAETVRIAAGMPDGDDSLQRADTALGNALVGKVQEYLATRKDEWDVELFFEVYGRPPREGGEWAQAIVNGLRSREDIPEGDCRELVEASSKQAIESLRAQ